MHLAPATPAELDLLASYMHGLYAEDPGAHELPLAQARQQAEKLLSAGRERVQTILLYTDAAVGYALLVPYYSNEYGGLTVFLDEFYIDIHHRSLGLGRSFLDLLKTHALQQGGRRMFLEVRTGNARAREFYRRHGFTVTDDRWQMQCGL
ncbi:MAG TPA: GNAT family N-acetyltransferase [Candidatus Xenobia bacterium]